METVSTVRASGGTQRAYRHRFATTGADMTFAVYVPPHADGARLPALLVGRGGADPLLADQLRRSARGRVRRGRHPARAAAPRRLRSRLSLHRDLHADHLRWHAERIGLPQ